jgi:hypothetical protein
MKTNLAAWVTTLKSPMLIEAPYAKTILTSPFRVSDRLRTGVCLPPLPNCGSDSGADPPGRTCHETVRDQLSESRAI